MYAGNSVVVNFLMRWPLLIIPAAAAATVITLVPKPVDLQIPTDLPTVVLKMNKEPQVIPVPVASSAPVSVPLPAPENKKKKG